jgi:hypothetical protein
MCDISSNVDVSSCDTIQHIPSTAPVFTGRIHLNCIVIKSSRPNVEDKIVVVPSMDVPLTTEQQITVIRRERAKMYADVSGNDAPSHDVSENTFA